MTCTRCLSSTCKVMSRFTAYARNPDPYTFQPLQNALLACAIASSYTNKGAASTVTEGMLEAARRRGC